ncbi:CHAD domain-containing protein [Rhodopirellula halodulae]|uniref:CHAD domain-containing protein n=1 Tax=Rhodopirellula halodulae TaxID=2894198 RepID=UPI001E5A1222|nr:CHAD domain-containing protein [Rhodopirellula sp. JC737]MCC9655053.1 CHAD domain-containing protein [Rhodopirellula sp. JC737]
MSYRIKRSETPQDALHRIANEQIDKALREIEKSSNDRHHAVHQVRKRCKKIRGLLRLVRPALGKTYDVENKAIRDAARRISAIRDAKTNVKSHDDLMDEFGQHIDRDAFSDIRLKLAKELQQISDDVIDHALAKVRQDLADVKQRSSNWRLKHDGYAAIHKGLTKTRRRAESRLDSVIQTPSTESLHEFRKRVKYHWYHLRLLKGVWPEAMTPMIEASSRLADQLGDDHDLAVFNQTAERKEVSKKTRQVLKGIADRKRETLQSAAVNLGRQLFAESTHAFDQRIRAYWHIWRDAN